MQSTEAAWAAAVNLCQAGVTYMHPSFQKRNSCYSSCCGKYRHPLLGIFIPCASQAPNMGTGSLQISSHWRKRSGISEHEPPTYRPHQSALHCWHKVGGVNGVPTSGPEHSQPRWLATIRKSEWSRAKSQIIHSTLTPLPGRMLYFKGINIRNKDAYCLVEDKGGGNNNIEELCTMCQALCPNSLIRIPYTHRTCRIT